MRHSSPSESAEECTSLIFQNEQENNQKKRRNTVKDQPTEQSQKLTQEQTTKNERRVTKKNAIKDQPTQERTKKNLKTHFTVEYW